jgi:hypothetical protein
LHTFFSLRNQLISLFRQTNHGILEAMRAARSHPRLGNQFPLLSTTDKDGDLVFAQSAVGCFAAAVLRGAYGRLRHGDEDFTWRCTRSDGFEESSKSCWVVELVVRVSRKGERTDEFIQIFA